MEEYIQVRIFYILFLKKMLPFINVHYLSHYLFKAHEITLIAS